MFSARHNRAEGHSAALGEAVRAAARFDRSLISFQAGAMAAIPVVAVLIAALAMGRTVPAVVMSVGAMLVGMAWRATGGRPPLGAMAADTLMMGAATFLGCVTGSVTWLHIAVLCLLSAAGGLLFGIGNRGGVVGTQAVIAAVVFGRFSEPAPQALGLAALVMAGGGAQVAFLGVVRWPGALRTQREATAAAYRRLAELARAPAGASTLPAGAALDEASASLASPTLLGDTAVLTLRSLVSEGYRLVLELTAIRLLTDREQPPSSAAAELLSCAARTLGDAADAIAGNRPAAQRLHRPEPCLAAVPGGSADGPLERRLAALAGQLRAVRSLAPAAGRGGGLLSRRPRPAAGLNRDLTVTAVVEQLRADMSLRSPIGRHALRLAVVVPISVSIARALPLERDYWVPVAAATVLRPEFGATFTRGTERALGTCIGVAIAGVVAAATSPGLAVTVALIGVLAWAGYATMPASFTTGFGFITALVVFLLDVLRPDTMQLAGARLLDTLIGSALGLVAYALWPTWARSSAWSALSELVSAQRAYLAAVLARIASSRPVAESRLRELSRGARLARTRAEAVVARSLTEPATRRIDADASSATLGATRRMVQAAHLLRLDAADHDRARPRPALEPFATSLDELLETVAQAMRSRAAGERRTAGIAALPDLRTAHTELARALTDDDRALLDELDELVDAADGLAAAAGVQVASEADSAPLPA